MNMAAKKPRPDRVVTVRVYLDVWERFNLTRQTLGLQVREAATEAYLLWLDKYEHQAKARAQRIWSMDSGEDLD
jgi:hypothetical protein